MPLPAACIDKGDEACTSWFDPFGEENIVELTSAGGDQPRLTRGAFGEISVAIFRPPPLVAASVKSAISDPHLMRVVALKTLFRSTTTVAARGFGAAIASQQSSKSFLNREVFDELCALRHLNPHPNIVKLLAVYSTRPPQRQNDDNGGFPLPPSLKFAFEYCPTDLHLSLEWRRCRFKPSLSLGVIRTVCHDLFQALEHCHSHGIVHRDVKCGNLLVSSSGTIQLCDFGIAIPITEGDDPSVRSASADRALCTLHYRPPEVLLGVRASQPSVDVYSAGTIVAELLTGRPLFAGRNDLDQLGKIFDVLGTPSPDTWPGAVDTPDYGKLPFAEKSPRPLREMIPRVAESDGLEDFLLSLAALDPSRRLTASVALSHDWVAGAVGGENDCGGTSKNARSILIEELVPEDLEAPLLLSPPPFYDAGKGLDLARRQALSLAATRRNFLSKLVNAARTGSLNGAQL